MIDIVDKVNPNSTRVIWQDLIDNGVTVSIKVNDQSDDDTIQWFKYAICDCIGKIRYDC